MIAYAFLVQRQQDKEPWPCIYTDLDLAVASRGRVSPVETIELRQNHWPREASAATKEAKP
jgi:hypothetical protein